MNSTLDLTAADKTQVASYIGKRASQPLGSAASPAASDAKTELLSLHRLVKRYGEAIAVNELSLTLGRGEVFGFLGPNGAGKTSTIRMLCGLTRPSAGYVSSLADLSGCLRSDAHSSTSLPYSYLMNQLPAWIRPTVRRFGISSTVWARTVPRSS